MTKRLNGFLRLSKIPKTQVTTTKGGEKGIYITVQELREPSKYGATHALTMWDATEKKAIYLADLKPKEWEDKKAENRSLPDTSEGVELPF